MNKKSNRFKLLFLALAVIIGIASCEKDKDDPKPSVVGFWEGNYGYGTTNPTHPYYFLFRSDGTVRVFADGSDTTNASKAEGTYIVTGTKVKTTYTYSSDVTYSTEADVDANFKTMDGTFGSEAATSGNGTFRVFKQ